MLTGISKPSRLKSGSVFAGKAPSEMGSMAEAHAGPRSVRGLLPERKLRHRGEEFLSEPGARILRIAEGRDTQFHLKPSDGAPFSVDV